MKLIKQFRENPTYELYSLIVEKIFDNYQTCRICGKHIYYENDTKFRIKKSGEITIYGKNFQTIKKHGHKLVICEKCLKNKFPEWDNLNKGKIFNTSNKITKWAFNIPNEDLYLYKTGVTKDCLMKKYGKKEGIKRWNIYRNKQANSNLFEYKRDKYGWTEDKFKKFNKSRGVTLKNLIKKYGYKEGIRKWDKYVKRQKETKSFEYMVQKFGLKKAKEINKSKGLTFNNYIKKFGDVLGKEKYLKHLKKIKVPFSKISQKLFNLIDEVIGAKYKTYYALKNYEYGVHTSIGYKKIDYYIKELKIAIEFNGNIFHGNPLYFNEYDNPNPYNKKLNAKDIWNNDKLRYKTLENEYNIRTIVIWESNFNEKTFNPNKFLKENGILL
jgi:hypothetical protein